MSRAPQWKRLAPRAGMITSGRMVALSVLDLSPVTTATPPSAALRNSLDLARLIDRLGYTRLWLAEHHNLANIASSAPDIMIGQVAAITQQHPRRLGRRDAAEPRALDGDGALQGAGGAVSRAHRSRARPRARHRPDHLAGAAPAPEHRGRAGRFPRPLPGDDAVREQGLSGKPSVRESRRDADRRAAAADLAARLERLFGASSPRMSARGFRSRITSRISRPRSRC